MPPTLKRLASRAEAERYKVETVRRFVPEGRLLDIGPSYGGFAYLASRAGFEVEVIERDPECCRFLTGVVGVRVAQSADVCAALAALPPYRVITLWQVIEHLPDPWRTLEAAADRLLHALGSRRPALF